MRIPRSTIVMAVLTCIPFGFAIRDYVNGKDKLGFKDDDGYSYDDDDNDAAYESYRAEVAAREEAYEREEARQEERKAQFVAAFDKLLGDSPATLGPAFGSIKPGITDTQLGKADETTTALRKLAREHNLMIAYDDSDGILHDVTITPTDDGRLSCDTLRDYLDEKWSDDRFRAASATVWIDRAGGGRAELVAEYGCSLTFRRAVPVAEWIANKGGVVPVEAIGQPTAKLVKSLEPQRLDLSDAEYELAWTGPGLGIGTGGTDLKAHIARGKVVALTARTSISADMKDDLVKHLDRVFGRSTEDDDGNNVWKKPRMILVSGYDSFELTIGTIPEE